MGMGIKISHTRVSLTTEKGLKKNSSSGMCKTLSAKGGRSGGYSYKAPVTWIVSLQVIGVIMYLW